MPLLDRSMFAEFDAKNFARMRILQDQLWTAFFSAYAGAEDLDLSMQYWHEFYPNLTKASEVHVRLEKSFEVEADRDAVLDLLEQIYRLTHDAPTMPVDEAPPSNRYKYDLRPPIVDGIYPRVSYAGARKLTEFLVYLDRVARSVRNNRWNAYDLVALSDPKYQQVMTLLGSFLRQYPGKV